MSMALKTDGFDGTYDGGKQFARLWCTAAVTINTWVAVNATDTSNPGAVDGESYKTADKDDAGAVWDTVGVAAETTSAAGWCLVQIAGRRTGVAVDTDGSAPANGDPLAIGDSGEAVELTSSLGDQYRAIGTCRSTPTSNTATVDIHRHPRFGG